MKVNNVTHTQSLLFSVSFVGPASLVTRRSQIIGQQTQLATTQAETLTNRNSRQETDPLVAHDVLYRCKLCDKLFSQRRKYKSHELYHKRKGRFKCQFCNQTFHATSDMERHERLHTGVKPFECIFCGKAFARDSNCKEHMKRHK